MTKNVKMWKHSDSERLQTLQKAADALDRKMPEVLMIDVFSNRELHPKMRRFSYSRHGVI